ncbi:hypothetical protein H0H81_012756 [Sphagnurus paluster]|uniref:NAD-dependent epimerase/dehydratase domain-containing protein n=1 Tax=Sphagnurus paluster TaxID=117069 RepID=A0A9P7G050_9AGAR|nr:hypothetical protein H0H81_012756 [Sphagnurus paluster]
MHAGLETTGVIRHLLKAAVRRSKDTGFPSQNAPARTRRLNFPLEFAVLTKDVIRQVTGASGFLGSHIVAQLLENGYNVRGAARGLKVSEMRKSYTKFGDRFQVICIPDVSIGHFPEAFKDVDAVIHTAAPLASRADSMVLFQGALEGTRNIVRQAQMCGIKRIVLTSSLATVANLKGNFVEKLADMSFTDKDWYPVDKEKPLEGSTWDVYGAAKTLAEQEVWAFGEAHPDMDITTINPPFLYGPFAEGFTMPSPDYYALSTNLYIYRFLKSSSSFPVFPGYVDVRDVAKAHVLALTGPPSFSVGPKRVVISSPHGCVFKEIINLIREKRPTLEQRINKDTPPTFSIDRLAVDFARIEEVLGFKKEEFRSIEDTILDTVDSLLAFEKHWLGQGIKIDIPDM